MQAVTKPRSSILESIAASPVVGWLPDAQLGCDLAICQQGAYGQWGAAKHAVHAITKQLIVRQLRKHMSCQLLTESSAPHCDKRVRCSAAGGHGESHHRV
jgi:hypothetical protein